MVLTFIASAVFPLGSLDRGPRSLGDVLTRSDGSRVTKRRL